MLCDYRASVFLLVRSSYGSLFLHRIWTSATLRLTASLPPHQLNGLDIAILSFVERSV